MSYTLIPLTVNMATGQLVDPANSYYPLKTKPKITAETIVVLGVHCVDSSGADYPLAEGDTFEIGGDIDHIHDADTGTLSGTLTAAAPVTAITATGLTAAKILATGRIRIYNSSNEFELIDYTEYDPGTGVFTVDHTMTYSYENGDRLVVNDNLMFYSANDMVDISGDWDDIDRTEGKFSIRVSARDDYFRDKLAGQIQDTMYIELRRYPSGETAPSKLLKDTVWAENTVINSAGEPGNTSVQFLAETSADARYVRQALSTAYFELTTVLDTCRIFLRNGSTSYQTTFAYIWTWIKSKLFPGSMTIGNLVKYGTDGILEDAGLDPDDILVDSDTGNLTEDTSGVLAITGGTGATIGNVTIQVKAAGTSQSGYLSSTDWNTFNGKQAALGYAAENAANKETSALDTSTTKYPCNNVVKSAVDAKQDSLGFTPENAANKATNFSVVNDTLYPTVKAVSDAIAGFGAGDFSGPASSTDNAIVRFNGTGGKTGQNSGIAVDDNNTMIFYDSATHAPVIMTARSAAPSSPAAGMIYLDDGTNTSSGLTGLRHYTGAAWEDISGSTGNEVSGTFADGDLVAGVLTISHSYGTWYPSGFSIYDNNNKRIAFPDELTIGNNTITVDLSNFGTLTGTWCYVAGDAVSGGGGDGDVVGPASATNGAVALYDGTTGKLLKNGYAIGTSANNIVQLDGNSKLPAVDGSQLTNLPGGFGTQILAAISGFSFIYPDSSFTGYANSPNISFDVSNYADAVALLSTSSNEPMQLPKFKIPAGTTSLKFRFVYSPETGNSWNSETVVWKGEWKNMTDNVAWSSVTAFSIGTDTAPASGSAPQLYEATVSLATLGLAAGDVVQMTVYVDSTSTWAHDVAFQLCEIEVVA